MQAEPIVDKLWKHMQKTHGDGGGGTFQTVAKCDYLKILRFLAEQCNLNRDSVFLDAGGASGVLSAIAAHKYSGLGVSVEVSQTHVLEGAKKFLWLLKMDNDAHLFHQVAMAHGNLLEFLPPSFVTHVYAFDICFGGSGRVEYYRFLEWLACMEQLEYVVLFKIASYPSIYKFATTVLDAVEVTRFKVSFAYGGGGGTAVVLRRNVALCGERKFRSEGVMRDLQKETLPFVHSLEATHTAYANLIASLEMARSRPRKRRVQQREQQIVCKRHDLIECSTSECTDCPKQFYVPPPWVVDKEPHIRSLIHIQSGGKFICDLDPDTTVLGSINPTKANAMVVDVTDREGVVTTRLVSTKPIKPFQSVIVELDTRSSAAIRVVSLHDDDIADNSHNGARMHKASTNPEELINIDASTHKISTTQVTPMVSPDATKRRSAKPIDLGTTEYRNAESIRSIADWLGDREKKLERQPDQMLLDFSRWDDFLDNRPKLELFDRILAPLRTSAVGAGDLLRILDPKETTQEEVFAHSISSKAIFEEFLRKKNMGPTMMGAYLKHLNTALRHSEDPKSTLFLPPMTISRLLEDVRIFPDLIHRPKSIHGHHEFQPLSKWLSSYETTFWFFAQVTRGSLVYSLMVYHRKSNQFVLYDRFGKNQVDNLLQLLQQICPSSTFQQLEHPLPGYVPTDLYVIIKACQLATHQWRDDTSDEESDQFVRGDEVSVRLEVVREICSHPMTRDRFGRAMRTKRVLVLGMRQVKVEHVYRLAKATRATFIQPRDTLSVDVIESAARNGLSARAASDLYRCVMTERVGLLNSNATVEVFSLDMEESESENLDSTRHIVGRFDRASGHVTSAIATATSRRRLDHVVLDWFFTPDSWARDAWNESFFTHFLPQLVEKKLLKDGASVFIPMKPYTLEMLSLHHEKLQAYYELTICDDNRKCPLYRGTAAIPDVVLADKLKRSGDQLLRYATLPNQLAGSPPFSRADLNRGANFFCLLVKT